MIPALKCLYGCNASQKIGTTYSVQRFVFENYFARADGMAMRQLCTLLGVWLCIVASAASEPLIALNFSAFNQTVSVCIEIPTVIQVLELT